jgi:hypothetical protein
MIKIDVEGAELLVRLPVPSKRCGAWKPPVVFEFGVGAADHYGTQTADVHALFASVDMALHARRHVDGGPVLTVAEFDEEYSTPKNYYSGARAAQPRRLPRAARPARASSAIAGRSVLSVSFQSTARRRSGGRAASRRRARERLRHELETPPARPRKDSRAAPARLVAAEAEARPDDPDDARRLPRRS